MRGTLPSAELSEDLRDRLLEVDPELEDFSYGPETYDAVVITALAAEVAGTDDPVAIAAEINGVTRDGTACTTFEECRDSSRTARTSITTVRVVPTPSVMPVSPRRRASRSSSTAPTTQIDDSLTEYQFAAIEE